ncbi:MAG: error-prone DNA polymerase [Deltaproteobacteria bacterium]|nr:error-prone DNA polymerase [Deltaproteobacteria bacterium]
MSAALWCKSNFAFLEGASHPEELVEEAARLGLDAVAITDRDGVYGVPRAHFAAKAAGIKLIVGSEVTLSDGKSLVLLCMTREGYANLCALVSLGRLREEKGESRVEVAEVCAHAAGLIAIMVDRDQKSPSLRDGPQVLALKAAFADRLYAGVARHYRAEETASEGRMRALAAEHDLPLVACNEVLYHVKARRPLQDVLTCVRHGVTLAAAGTLTKPNAEYALKSPAAMQRLFDDDPALVTRTRDLARRCTFSMDELRYRYPSERLPNGMTSLEYLRELTFTGARGRYGEVIPDDVTAQLDKELALIDTLDFPGYFLTMHEIVVYCRAQAILCQGRGSAANSAVCYCLGITAVDPVRMKLLFERFISLERQEPPDIDLDIEHERREEVIQHVYEKYGRSHAAMVANVIRYRTRSALRDVGKVLGFSETALDRMSKLFSHYDDLSDVPAAVFDVSNPLHDKLATLAREILDFPRHLSIHPGGFLLGHEPIATLVPIENATMPGRTVIQWDKRDVEALGLFKVDLLGLGALTQVDLAMRMLKDHKGIELSMATVPAEDPETYAMLQRADTVGVFQIESRAQMSMLPRLKPKSFYDLVIEVSIVRPGPITGGMVHPYLRRRNGEEAIDYPHPSLEPVLDKTLGIPLFQEQVMKLAVIAADYTPGEADQLRRDMAAWKSSGKIEQHRERLINRMIKKGIAPEFAERVFQQIRGFGEYGFPESHAASFALIAYVTSWLRRHHLDVFTCALLNAQPMGFYSPATIIEDARRHGLEILPIDVRSSAWECTLEKGPGKLSALRVGLRYVRGLDEAQGRRIVATGKTAETLDAFFAAAAVDKKAQTALAEADALLSYGVARRQALWSVADVRPVKGKRRTSATSTRELELNEEPMPEFAALNAFEEIAWDYAATSCSSRGHVLSAVREALQRERLPDARTVAAMSNGKRTRYAGIVICRQRPGTASGVTFMTLEDETGFVNLVVWKKIFDAFHIVAKTTSFLGVTGRVQNENGVVHVIADELWRPKFSLPEVASRDFH